MKSQTRAVRQRAAHLPFPALVGLETAQQALLLLAVEPRLRGVVLAAGAGAGKSSIARGMRALLHDTHTPFVEIPTGVDMDNLIGGLDLPATLRAGGLVLRAGVLARAHQGVAYVDGVNLLSDATVNTLLAALDEGQIRVEREGMSFCAPAQFSLIATYDPGEGAPRRHLLDRVGLLAALPAQVDANQRAEIVRRNLITSPATWEEDVAVLRAMVIVARENLPFVTIRDDQIERLTYTALLYGAEGHRVDLFAVYAACAAAALGLKSEVDDEDLSVALRLVILPRATRIPTPQDQQPPDEPPPPEPPDPSEPDDAELPPDEAQLPSLLPPPEQILSALDTALPENLEDLPFHNLRRGRSGSRGSTLAKRGRHIRSLPGDPRRARIDASATLRAAAPWQEFRRSHASHPPAGRFAFEMGDLRVKQFRSKAGALFCFAVDASGSMALHRMRQAKGAAHALLEKAYVHRDRVALIAFRGPQAELLLPATQSVELARRALDLLPTGGGTPLASALLLALDVAAQAKQRGILQTVLILLTDGRANVSARPDTAVKTELEQLGRYIAASTLRVMVVDTQRSYLSRGEAKQLAQWLGGDYAYLPGANGEQIADLASQVVATE